MTEKATYLMIPDMHVQLSMVRGFNKMNGDTYQDYIIKNLGSKLTQESITRIRETRMAEEALKVLQELNIPYTHDWDEDTES